MTELLTIDAPPQAIDAEKSVLGACALSRDALDAVAILLAPEQFYSVRHQLIYAAMLSMRERNIPVDAVTLCEELTARHQMADCGGPVYVLECLETVPHAFHAEHYARIVVDRARRRAAANAARGILGSVQDLTETTDNILASAEDAIHGALEYGLVKQDVSIEAALLEVFGQLESGRSLEGLSTGWASIDAILGDMQPGSVVVIGARPSVGKTAFSMTMLRRLAEVGAPGCLMSYEMTRSQIAERCLAGAAGLTIRQLRKNELTKQERERLVWEAEILGKLPILIDDSNRDLPQLLAALRVAVRRHKLKIVVIDYLQLVPSGGRFATREQEVAFVSRSLKAAAKSLGIVMVILCQLNRAAELREGEAPRLSDLRESGSIEQDADQVLFLWRPNKGNEGAKNVDDRDDHGMLAVAKNRQGQLGRVKLAWHGPTMTYRDWVPTDDWQGDGGASYD